MPWFENPYEEYEYQNASRIWVEPFGEVTYYEADVIEELRAEGLSDKEIEGLYREY